MTAASISRIGLPVSVEVLRWGDEIAFQYKGLLIDDGMFIKIENSAADLTSHGDPQPEVPFPRLRCMFSGSTFGRFELSEVAYLEVIK